MLILYNRYQHNRPYGEINNLESFALGDKEIILQPSISKVVIPDFESLFPRPIFDVSELPFNFEFEWIPLWKRIWRWIKRFIGG